MPERRYRFPGRRRVDNRAAMEGILFVISTGMRWNDLPTTVFGSSGAACWRRLKEWYGAGVWQRLHEGVLAELRAAGLLDLAHAVVGSSYLLAQRGDLTGPSPVDRGRLGSKHHLITDAGGLPLAVILTTATTSPSYCPCSMRFHRSVGGQDDPNSSLAGCSPTAGTTTTSTAGCCGNAASP